ncbi:tetratricopeptide repeat protein [Pseudodesulfovibrio sp. zrk46]|uniref:tetratricopeptide repeat protein n=1 Tax=Pseudodesulfovibrio sp. zrk46 TaxID=2725288 RepID=UPI001449DEF8|nr:tetratricopeptide repeat protein [Pseudodesulfovibrio sp. zrk46]QJB57786.1 tetratricopeptide repeat protein [Pseudodesulfovibrio sp. zrk46]
MGVHKRQREQDEIKEHYIKKTSCIMFVIAALLVGAFVGNTITVLYLGNKGGTQTAAVQQGQQQPTPTANMNTLNSLESAANSNPTDPNGWIKLGNYCFDNNLPGKAVNAYERALEIRPMNVGVWSDLGVMYRRTQRFQEAINAFSQAVKLDKNHKVSRFNMGIVYLHDLNDKVNAKRVWEELLSIDPNAKAPNGKPVADLVSGLN